MNSFTLGFGALQKPLAEQLQDQGITVAPEKMELCQKLAKGITLAYVHGILTESEVNKARQRLMKKVRTVLERNAARQAEKLEA